MAAKVASGGSLSDALQARKIFVKGGVASYNYEEPEVMRIHGEMFRVHSELRSGLGKSSIPTWYSVRGGLSFGRPTYDGAVVDLDTYVRTPTSVQSSDMILEFEASMGISLLNGPSDSVAISVGVGYWYLHNLVSGSGSYTRQTTYFYLPLGLQYFRTIGPKQILWTIGVQNSVFLLGKVASKLSEASPSLTDQVNTQNSGKGLKLSTSVEFAVFEQVVLVEIYRQSWNIEKSDIRAQGSQVFWEPKNSTQMTGINVGVQF